MVRADSSWGSFPIGSAIPLGRRYEEIIVFSKESIAKPHITFGVQRYTLMANSL